MARPRKNTVDYFPHSCKHGKTLYIVEQRFGNDGYSFLFKLFEYLGSSENHFIDLNKETEIEFLGAKTRLSIEKTKEILDLLAKLDSIDKKLWSKKIIWSQNFVDGIADVYKKRNNNVPEKPSLKSIEVVSDTDNPQSKVKKTKVKKTKVDSMTESDFNFFWKLYPNKQAKKKAKEKFMKIDMELFPKIIETLKKQIKSEAWKKDNGQFIPHPTTWLYGERWDDVLEVDSETKRPRKEWTPPK